MLVAALLVSCTAGWPASVSDDSKVLSKPDRCSGLWGSWFCWGFTWGSVREGSADSQLTEMTQTAECLTVRCYAQRMLDFCFDVSGMFFDNPIKLWITSKKMISATVYMRLPVLWKILGAIFVFLMLNVLAFIYLRVADVLIYVWGFGKWICRFPLVSLLWGALRCMYKFMLSIPKKAEKEKEREQKEKKANSIAIPSSQLLKELGERLAEQEKMESKADQEPETIEPVVCPHCGRYGHKESVCHFKFAALHGWKKPYKWQKKSNRGSAQPEGNPSTSGEKEKSGNVSMIHIEDQTALHTPIWINGVKFPRCLIDTGSEVNVMSVKDAIKHGFKYEMGGIQKITGFNGNTSAVDGMMMCKVQLGLCGEGKEVEFLVTAGPTIPIIGCPTLAELRISLDCQERILSDEQGNIVRCSAVFTPKN